MRQILIRDIMTPSEKVIRISPYARVRELLSLMQTHNVKSVIVDRTSEHDAFGIVTYTSVLNAIFAEDGDMDLINVYDISAKPVICVNEELDVRYAARLMVKYEINRLLVLEGNQLRGIVSINDIIKELMKDL